MAIKITIGFLAFLLIILGVLVQFGAYMNLDNAWLLNVAERVVSGQKLHVEVIESNPPLIVQIMKLPVLLGDFLGISHIHGFIIFICLLGLASIALCARQVKDERILLALVFGIFLMPGWAYGEREHIFVILILPYFVAQWRQEKQGLLFSVIVGLMAGIGFSLKPFFVLVWGTVMLTKMLLEKRFFAPFTLQNIVIGLVMVAYVLWLVFIDQLYLQEIFPQISKYYGGFNGKLKDVFKQSFSLAILCQVAFWVLFIKDRQSLTRPAYFSNFANLACIALILIQGKAWTNYFYPPNFFGVLTNVLVMLAMFDGNIKPLWNKVALGIAGFIIAVFLTMAITGNIKTGFRIKEGGTDKMVRIINQNANGKYVATLNFDLGAVFPAILYSEAEYRGRYGHLYMLPGMYRNPKKQKDDEVVYHKPEERNEDEKRLMEAVVSDFINYPPALIVVTKMKYYSPDIGNYNFDFVKYFSQDERFAKLWANYEKIDTVGKKHIYRVKQNSPAK